VERNPYTPPTGNPGVGDPSEDRVKRWRRYAVFGLLGSPFLVVAACFGLIEYDIANVRSACAALKPGTSVNDVRAILSEHGLERHAPDANGNFPHDIPGRKAGTRFFAIPAASTMGDMSCGVTHDGVVIVEADARGP
jgi:hypothetical protein